MIITVDKTTAFLTAGILGGLSCNHLTICVAAVGFAIGSGGGGGGVWDGGIPVFGTTERSVVLLF